MKLWIVAWKNLFRRRLRSVATMTGTALAVATMVTLVGLAEQFEASFRQLLDSRGVDLIVYPAVANQRAGSVVDERIAEQISPLLGVRVVAPVLIDQTSLGQDRVIGVPLSGWAANSPLLAQLTISEGRSFVVGDGKVVLLGRGLARQIGKNVGDAVEIEVREFRVIGIYESTNLYENGAVIVPLNVLQELIDRRGKVSGFAVFLTLAEKSEDTAGAVIAAVRGLRDPSGQPLGLEAERPQEFAARKIEMRFAHAIAWMTSAVALVLTSIMILNTMLMSVGERTTEIGILRGIGWQRSRIVRLVLWESCLLNLSGATCGCLMGLAAVTMISHLPIAQGLVAPNVPPAVLLKAFGLGLVTGLLGGIYPAIRAASLDPTEAIRHA